MIKMGGGDARPKVAQNGNHPPTQGVFGTFPYLSIPPRPIDKYYFNIAKESLQFTMIVFGSVDLPILSSCI